ncbi:hypothetical protein PIB30_048500 [Stylosanthes scabra]|uniref:Uncharacterized protein n=1 Tax=Stylosanthes scabra TaxID=79078 RepID=A0ABU6TGT3_9FABA|nr:hypothetical protein [Stylosanthes scabra]
MYPPPYPTYSPILYPPPSSPPQSSDYGSIFQSFHSLAKYAQPKPPPVQPTGLKTPPPKEPRPRPPWKPEFREFFPGSTSGVNTGDKEKEKASDRTINLMAQNDSTSEEESSTDFSEETSEEDHIVNLSAIAMVNPADEESDEGHLTEDKDNRQPRQTAPSIPQPDLSSSKSGNFYFIFDDIDPDKYRQRLNDFGAWVDTRMTILGMAFTQVHTEFITRMIGNLREWMNGFSQYEKMGLVNGTSEYFLGLIHKEFLGDITIIQKRNSQEYYEMKCCSLNRRDLKTHYKRIISKYYSLGGNTNPPLKHVFMASLPEELQPETENDEHVQADAEAFPETQSHSLKGLGDLDILEGMGTGNPLTERGTRILCLETYLIIKLYFQTFSSLSSPNPPPTTTAPSSIQSSPEDSLAAPSP